MSSSFSSSNSTSTPSVDPQEIITQNILNSIAGVATNYANTMYNWGQGVFNGLSGDISGLMGKLGQAADTALTGAKQAAGAFQNDFMPDYNNLRTEAAQYANPARQARNAGLAESDQMQANQSAINDATQKLESMGIDTSSGRYAHDILSGKTAGAAAAAGAGTSSIRADEQTALGLKKNALDYGIQFPGIAANFLNQANQANSISGNLDIGKTNAGTALMQLPNAYLNTAMQDRFPPTGQTTRSSSSGTSSGPQPNPSSSNRSSGGPAPSNPFGGATPSPFDSFAMNHGGGGQGTPTNSGFGGGFGGGGQNVVDLTQNPNYGSGEWGNFDDSYNGMSGPDYSQFSQNNDIYAGGQSDPYESQYGNYNSGGQDFGSYGATDGNNYGYGIGQDPVSDYNMGSVADTGGWDSGPNTNYNDSYNYNDTAFDSGGGGGAMDQGYDQGSYSNDYSDYGGDYGGGFATGGAIPENATTGGFVPKSASPSGGQVTDDVHASVNADEFVVPKDVALWKGQEFFQKLIAQSRQNLAKAGARGKPAPAPQGPVRFASRPMGQ